MNKGRYLLPLILVLVLVTTLISGACSSSKPSSQATSSSSSTSTSTTSTSSTTSSTATTASEQTSTSSQAEVIELKFADWGPAGAHPISIFAESYADEIEKRTNGKVKIILYSAGSLLQAPGIYDGVVTGVADIGDSAPSHTRGRFKLTEALELPLSYPNAVVASKVIWNTLKEFNPAELDDVYVLYAVGHGVPSLLSSDKVTSMEDIKGMKIRATGNTTGLIQKLGALPIAMPMTDSYDAMRKGTVEANICANDTLDTFKLAEVINYITPLDCISYTTVHWVVINKAKFDSFPSDVQDIFLDVGEEWVVPLAEAWDEIDNKALANAQASGKEIVELSPDEAARWAEAVNPVIEDYITEMESQGLPAREVVDYIQNNIAEMSK